MIINSTLTWKDHIETISNKVSKSTGIILSVRNNVNDNVLLTLYHTLLLPYYNYCNIIWAAQRTIYLDKLFIKQKKAVRIICRAKWNAHTNPLFFNLKLLTICNLNKLQTYCFMYKIVNNLLPDSLKSWFRYNSDVHNYNTRGSTKLHITSHNTALRANSIIINGAKLWNDLNADIKILSSFYIFKGRCKLSLIGNNG